MLTRPDPADPADGGFTLIELLIVMSLLLVVGGIVTSGVVGAFQASRRAQDRVYGLTELEAAVQRITREARTATQVTVAGPGTLELTVPQETGRTRFRYQVDGGGTRVTETVDRYASATAATPVSTRSQTLIDDLDQSATATFAYQVADGTAWTAARPLDDIAHITVTLVRDLPEQGAIQVRTTVYRRNSR